MKRLLLIPLCSAPSTFAQSITTGPLIAVPVNSPWMLLVLVLLLLGASFVLQRRKGLSFAVTPILVLATAAVLWQAPTLRAQILLAFVSTSGETLPITVDYDGATQSFTAADFINNSGVLLNIRQIVLPTFGQCFPGGLLPMVAPPPAVFTPCSEGQSLSNNASCRVDVHSVCQTLALVAATQISVNTSTLVLSVNDPGADPALPGNPRLLQMTNTGVAPASNVQVNTTALPIGTSISSNTCTGTLNAGATCVITITPGGTASSDVGNNACSASPGTEPVPSLLTLTADNALPTEVDLLVLGYGCIYQGGFLFAVDDTSPNTGSIAGKVAALADEGISQWAMIPDDTNADSLTDGSANTASLIVPAGQYPAAQACSARNDQGYMDWYLPAICEVGRFVGLGSDAGCGSTQANLYTTLHTNALGGLANANYWSSTEFAGNPLDLAWVQNFGIGSQTTFNKLSNDALRCVRTFTP